MIITICSYRFAVCSCILQWVIICNQKGVMSFHLLTVVYIFLLRLIPLLFSPLLCTHSLHCELTNLLIFGKFSMYICARQCIHFWFESMGQFWIDIFRVRNCIAAHANTQICSGYEILTMEVQRSKARNSEHKQLMKLAIYHKNTSSKDNIVIVKVVGTTVNMKLHEIFPTKLIPLISLLVLVWIFLGTECLNCFIFTIFPHCFHLIQSAIGKAEREAERWSHV